MMQIATRDPVASRRTTWVDAEVHVFPPEWCRDGYAPPGDEPVMRRVVYDHPERHAALARATVDDLLAEMDAAGIDHAVIMGLPWRSVEQCRRHDEYVAEAVHRYPDRLFGFGVLPPPRLTSPRDAVRRIADELGLQGVKVIPSWQGWRLDDPILAPALDEIAARDMILMTHVDHAYVRPEDADLPCHVVAVAERHPHLRLLAAHLGGLLCLYDLYPPLRAALRNVRYITSVPLTMPMVRFAVEAVGPDRLAFGTDYPFNPSHDQRSVRRGLESLGLDDETTRRIAGSILDWLRAPS